MSTITENKPHDVFHRGKKAKSPLGTAVFVFLRILDPILQYQLLANGLADPLFHLLGLKVLPDSVPTTTGIPFIDNLGLSPYRLALLAMAIGSSVKQIFWNLHTNQEYFPPSAAFGVAAANTFCNSINSLVANSAFLSPAASASFPQAQLVVGGLFYVAGALTESVSEYQRKAFKDDLRNKGKCYTGGLWSLARHINYGGFSLWRGGYAMASGGWVFGVVVTSLFVKDLGFRATPILDEYCTARYGEKWTEFKRKTPYKMFPGIW